MRLLSAIAAAAALAAGPAAAEPGSGRPLMVPSISTLAQRVEIKRTQLSSPPAPADVQGQVPDEVSTLEQEVKDLKARAGSLEDDKKALVHTVQEVLQTNQTLVLKRQIDDLVNMKAALEMRCARERAELEAKVNETRHANDAKAQAALEEQDSNREVLEALREQDLEMQDVVAKLRAENEQLRKQAVGLAADKANLMNTLHSVLKKSAEAENPVKPAPAKAKTPVVRHDKKPASHHRQKQADNGTKEEHIDWSDDTIVMGETKEISAYLRRVHQNEAVEKASAEAAAEAQAAKKPKKLLRWLDLDASADGKVTEVPKGESPLDMIAPSTTPAPPAAPAAEEGDDGVSDLLNQAEAEAAPSADADSDDAA